MRYLLNLLQVKKETVIVIKRLICYRCM